MTAGSVHDDLRRLRWWVALTLTLLALVVLALRAVGLAVALIVATAERADVAAAIRAGITPLGASSWLISTAVPAPDWTRTGGE